MKKRSLITLSSFVLTAALLIPGCSTKQSINQNSNDKEKQITLSASKDKIINLNLYFDSSQDSNIPNVTREERSYNYDELMGEIVIQELIKGPSIKDNMRQLLPRESRLLSLSVKDGIAYVNFSREANIVLSPLKEQALVESIVMSLTEIPTITKVKLFIEDNDQNIWGGNMDLTKPLGRTDFNSSTK